MESVQTLSIFGQQETSSDSCVELNQVVTLNIEDLKSESGTLGSSGSDDLIMPASLRLFHKGNLAKNYPTETFSTKICNLDISAITIDATPCDSEYDYKELEGFVVSLKMPSNKGRQTRQRNFPTFQGSSR